MFLSSLSIGDTIIMLDPDSDGDHDDWDDHEKWKGIIGNLDEHMQGNAIYCSQFEIFKRRRAGKKSEIDRLWARMFINFLFWLGMLFTGPIGFFTYFIAQKDPETPSLMFLYQNYRLMFAIGCFSVCGTLATVCIILKSYHFATFFLIYGTIYIFMKYIFPFYGYRDRVWKRLAFSFQLNVAHITGTTSSWFLILVCLIAGAFGVSVHLLIESDFNGAFDFLGNFFGLTSSYYYGLILLIRLVLRTDVALDQLMPRDIEARQILNLMRKPEVWNALLAEHKRVEESEEQEFVL